MNNDWEKYGPMWRIKVDGGHIYQDLFAESNSICFVPEIDLTRYQAHLRDAYRKGYEDGQNDAKHGSNQFSQD